MRISRRSLIRRGLGACAASSFGFPAIVRAQGTRPAAREGAASGDVTADRAVIWTRADRPSRLLVEYATTPKFENALRRVGPAALESSDFTARVLLSGLPPGQRIFYRVRFQDLADLRSVSDPVAGSFRTPDAKPSRAVTIAWSADTVGQGWGIDTARGGLRTYEAMRAVEPDLFVNCGDTIYADGPLASEVTLDDGTMWRNVVTESKSRVAQTLEDYRGNYRYNLLDEHMRRFNAEVPQIAMWDDHEVRDNWYETRSLESDARYSVKSTALLAARARQAFLEYHPIVPPAEDPERIYRTIGLGPLVEVFVLDLRSYRGANSENRQAAISPESAILGSGQLEALKARLASSTAAWKVIASDMPVGLIVRDGPAFFEAVANGEHGGPLGRELEVADLLRFVRDRRIRNIVWITGDVHYCAAHHYDPARAAFTEFSPFWEFVAGPLHAGTFGPAALDRTFGPEVRFKGIPDGMKGNRPPSEGLQFFGVLRIDPHTRALTASLRNLEGKVLYQVELGEDAA